MSCKSDIVHVDRKTSITCEKERKNCHRTTRLQEKMCVEVKELREECMNTVLKQELQLCRRESQSLCESSESSSKEAHNVSHKM